MEDVGDKQGVRARSRRVGQQRRALDDTLRGIMASAGGRMWLWDVLSTCRSFELEVPSDAIAMAFRNGERNVGIKLLTDLMRVSPEEFVVMMREANGMVEHDGSSGSDNDDGPGDPLDD